jgi:predicted NBD/HSP70 family sugar kinase
MHPSYVRQLHASQIFHALRVWPGISQRELCAMTGCDKSTVSVIIKRFEELELVERFQGQSEGQRGRPLEKLRLSEHQGLLVGVHLELGVLRTVASTIGGKPIDRSDAPLPTHPDDLAASVQQSIQTLCAKIGRSPEEIRGVGVCLPGLVRSGGRLAHSPQLHWTDVPVQDLLRESVSAPIYVDNDTNAAALAEHMFGACTQLDDFVMLQGGSGIGGGIFLNGRVYRGKDGYAAELGHIKVVKDGRMCSCGAMGCLSAYVSTNQLVERLSPYDGDITSLEDLRFKAESGDVNVIDVLEEAGEFLGVAVSDIINSFNPPAIVLAGTLAVLEPYLRHGLRRSLRQNTMPVTLEQVEIIVSSLSIDPILRAGVALALEGFTSLDRPEATPW